ncbi:MAG: DUF433 domain-containing protein [Pirellulales bacterium]|nr:DUF433 domain-containing protein [Pirellulales bacterium]
MTIPVLDSHIECTPNVCGGKPRIAGHRIRVQDIMVWHELQGLSADEIVAQYPQLSLGDVYAALTYYHDHREEIRQSMKEDEEFVKQLQANTPSKLQKKLSGGDA